MSQAQKPVVQFVYMGTYIPLETDGMKFSEIVRDIEVYLRNKGLGNESFYGPLDGHTDKEPPHEVAAVKVVVQHGEGMSLFEETRTFKIGLDTRESTIKNMLELFYNMFFASQKNESGG